MSRLKIGLSVTAHSVSRYQFELGAILEEDVAGGLLWVDADAAVGDDRAGGCRNLELISHKLDAGSEGGILRHGNAVQLQQLCYVL